MHFSCSVPRRSSARDIEPGVVKSIFFFSRENSAAALQFQVHSGWPRARAHARIFLEPSTRGRALQLERTCAHIRRRRHSESWYAGTFSLSSTRGLHGPDTINVLYSTSRTKTRGRGRGGRPTREGSRGRRIRTAGRRRDREG